MGEPVLVGVIKIEDGNAAAVIYKVVAVVNVRVDQSESIRLVSRLDAHSTTSSNSRRAMVSRSGMNCPMYRMPFSQALRYWISSDG